MLFVTSIQDFAFYGCNNVTNITLPFIGASRTATGYSSAFGYIFGYNTTGSSSSVSKTTPYNKGDIYSVDTQYSRYVTSCSGSGTSYTVYYSQSYYYNIPSSIKTVTITDATQIPSGAFNYCRYITKIVLNDGITSVGEYAFYSCSVLKGFAIPNSVSSIGKYSFYGCTGLTEISIPNGVTTIPEYTFYNCSKLTSITISDSVTSIGYYAFFECTSLTSITIPNSVTSIGNSAFRECKSLTSITIPNSVTSIGEYAFNNCSSLTSVTIPDSVTSIGKGAFDYCSSRLYNNYKNGYYLGNESNPYLVFIKVIDKKCIDVEINENCNIISGYAFEDCVSLINVSIPDSVTSIGDCAFEYCRSLTSITYGGTKTQWNAIQKGSNWNDNTGNYVIHCTDGDITK